jgi:hemolysin activation/secretion protein
LTVDSTVASLELTVSRFVLEGADPALQALAAHTFAPLQGHKVKVDAIYAAIADLEQTFVDHGHFLTRIIIPPQHVDDGGELQLRVIHGFIQWLDLDGLPDDVRAHVSAILMPLVNDPPARSFW